MGNEGEQLDSNTASTDQPADQIDVVNCDQPQAETIHENIHEIEPAYGLKQEASNNDLPINLPEHKHQKLRIGLLAVLVTGSLLIFLRSIIDSGLGKPTPLIFPEKIELAQAKTTQSEAIVDTKNFPFKPKYLSGQSYRFLVDNQPIDVALRYAVGTEGDIPIFLKELVNIDLKDDELRQKIVRRDPIGYYAAFTYQDRAYLTACINPRGISTVTKEQFDDNASDRAMDRDVLISWLLGQRDLRDRRCLWTLISTPLTADSDHNAITQKLEKIWISWYEWWKPKFPQP